MKKTESDPLPWAYAEQSIRELIATWEDVDALPPRPEDPLLWPLVEGIMAISAEIQEITLDFCSFDQGKNDWIAQCITEEAKKLVALGLNLIKDNNPNSVIKDPALLLRIDALRSTMRNTVTNFKLERSVAQFTEASRTIYDSAAKLSELQNQQTALSVRLTNLSTIQNENEKNTLSAIASIRADVKDNVPDFAAWQKKMLDQEVAQDQLMTALKDLERRYFEATPRMDKVLTKTNQTALASSFEKRYSQLGTIRILWGVVLFGILAAMTWLGLNAVEAYNQISLKLTITPETATQHVAGDISIREFFLKISIVFPLIWAAWFSAKQYGFTSKLQEDYAFKVASATSFEAYKTTATQVDAEVLKELIQTTIKNFSENPLRIYDGSSEASSPIQELAEALSKTEKFLDRFKQSRSDAK